MKRERVKWKKGLALTLCMSMFATLFTGSAQPIVSQAKQTKQIETQSLDLSEHVVQTTNGYDLFSPDKQAKMSVYTKSGQLYYNVTRSGKDYMKESKLGITVNNVDYGKNAVVGTPRETQEIVRDFQLQGKQKDNQEHCIYTELPLTAADGNTYAIQFKIFNDGVAFQYNVPAATESTVRTVLENTQFVVPEGSMTWAAVDNENYANYETIISQTNPINAITDSNGKDVGLLVGVTFDLPGEDGYSAILEGNMNDTYAGTSIAAKGNNVYQIRTRWNKSTPSLSLTGSFQTPWRIVCIADDLNELVNNNILYAVNASPDSALFDDMNEWVIPGRSAWSWLNGMVPAVNPQNMKLYTELAARLGFEYNTIDEGWVFWNGSDKYNYDSELYKLDLTRIAEYGDSYGVRQFLWNCITDMTGNMPGMGNIEKVETFLDLMQETGIAGGKIDFWPGEDAVSTVKLELETLQKAAERKLLLNLHGIHKGSGWEVTYPNEVTREGIRGYEQVNYDENSLGIAYAPYVYYTTQAYTRNLQGHADFTPHVRSAGEIATLVFGDSPVNMISTDPADILTNPAVEMIKSIPTVWDRTYVLPDSEIGRATIFAREKDQVWYIGGVADNGNKAITIDFSQFLDDGNYLMEMWRDTAAMSSTGVGGAKESTSATISSNSTYNVNMIEHGGFVMRLTKLQLSQYGGEIKANQPLVITTPSANSVVKYTLDGTDPAASSTATIYNSPITMTQSCDFRATITAGDGIGTSVSHRFNLIDEDGRLKSDLRDALDKAATYLEDHYTDQSYQNLQESVQRAEAAYTGNASQTEMLEACNSLLAAIKVMEKRTFNGVYTPDLNDLSGWNLYEKDSSSDVTANDIFTSAGGAITVDYSKAGGTVTNHIAYDGSATKFFNGVLEFTFKLGQVQDTDDFGFVLRHKNKDNYMVIDRNNGAWELKQKIDGVETSLGAPVEEYETVVFSPGENYQVKVIYKDQVIDLYINGNQTARFQSGDMYAGLGTYGFRNGVAGRSVSIENLTASDYDYYQRILVTGSLYDYKTDSMTATAGSQQNSTSEAAGKVLDGDETTIWHTSWSGAPREDHYIIIDLGGSKLIDGLRYQPRQSGGNNGIITQYAIDVSTDGVNYNQVASGYWAVNNEWKKVTFALQDATHVRLRSIASESDRASQGIYFTSAAEVRVTRYQQAIKPDEEREIPLGSMTATAGSAQGGEDASKAIDDNTGTIWHTSWNGTTADKLYLTLDLGGTYMVDGFRYLPRQTGDNGKIREYQILVSTNGQNFNVVAQGSWDKGIDWKKVKFESVAATHVRLVGLTTETDGSGKLFASAAEVRVIGDKVQ